MKILRQMIKLKNNNLYYFLIVLVALLPVMIFRDFTPSNELRYLSIADEAIRNNTFFTFYNHGLAYADKPPLYIWVVMLGKWLFGTHHMWFLSLFSLIPAFVIIKVMDSCVAGEMSAELRNASRWMMITCGLFLGLAITLRMDMLMCMFIVLALRVFYRMKENQGNARTNAILFPVYVFLALFSKGPIGILVPLLSITVYLFAVGRIKEFGRYWGWTTWGILLVCCAVWFGAVYAEGGEAYLNNLLFHQTIDRAVDAFHHKAPFYYYLVSVWYSIAPWSLFAISVIILALVRKKGISDLQKLFLSVIVTTFVMLSCISSKLQVYLLPAFPFIVYCAALYIPKLQVNAWLKAMIAVPSAIFILVLPLMVAATVFSEELSQYGEPLFYVAAAVLTISGIVTVYFLYKSENGVLKAVRSLSVGLLLAVFAGGMALPSINHELGYGELCKKAKSVAQEHNVKTISTWGVSRAENIDVYLGQQVNVIDKSDDPSKHVSEGDLLLIRNRDIDKFGNKESWTVGKYAIVLL